MIRLKGVLAAAITPLREDYSPDPEGILELLNFLANRGCHGALLLGTTGEGPSLSPKHRQLVLHSAMEIRQEHPEFFLLAGTGTPSLDETIDLTKTAFDLGFDAVVVLPPYYYRNVSEDGLFSWFSTVIRRSSPRDGPVLGYHFPAVSGVPLSIGLISRLRDAFSDQFIGIKDSSGKPEFAETLGSQFGDALNIFNGNDRLFSHALNCGAAGCITATANLISPNIRNIWNSFQIGSQNVEQQIFINGIREILDRYTPFPPLIKALLHRLFGFPMWSVCPPLLSLSAEEEDETSSLLSKSGVNQPITEDRSNWH